MQDFTTRRPGLRVAAAVLAAVVGVNAMGCFGSFNLTRDVYYLNKNISENRWAQSGTMLAFVAFQFYPLAMAADLILFNVIEFWHRNPIKTFTAESPTADGGVATFDGQADGSLLVRVQRPDGAVDETRLVEEGHAVAAYAADGSLLGRYELVAGVPTATEGPLAVR